MRIVCGTDFSARAREAADVAALLAARANERLMLVHALDARGAVFGAAHVLQTLESAARERLEAEAKRLRRHGAAVDIAMPDGWPDEALVSEAARHNASLIVLGATGARDGPGVMIGKTCERTLSRTTMPMLVVRDSTPLLAWLDGEKPLRILVAFDFSDRSAGALAFAARFAQLGACRIVVAFASDPKREAARMGLRREPEEARRRLHDAITDRVARLEPDLPAEVVISDHSGDPAARLAHLSEHEDIDLVISGTHQRRAIQRLFAGSVSLQLLREAATNLIAVPGFEIAASPVPRREVLRVLVATDLSETGNRAVSHALALAPAGAEVLILHVMSPNQMPGGAYGRASRPGFEGEHEAERSSRERAMQSLLAVESKVPGRVLRSELIEHEQPATAIIERAEEYDADLICIGTLGRSGMSVALLGSTAQDVLRLCRRPLLLVPPPERF